MELLEGFLEPLGAHLGALGVSQAVIWAILGAAGRILGLLEALLGPFGRVLGASWPLLGPFLDPAWPYVGQKGRILDLLSEEWADSGNAGCNLALLQQSF